MKVTIILNKQVGDASLIKEYFNTRNLEVFCKEYSGNLLDYYHIAQDICNNKFDKGVIVTNNGVGAFLVTTKVKSSIAVPLLDEYTAEYSVAHNNAKIAILPLSIISESYAVKLIDIFFNATFHEGRHSKRLAMMNKLY